MAKHTPGPWEFNPVYDKMRNCLVVDNAKGNIQVRTDNITADARLIAAAPELLALAKEALAQLEKMDFTCSANWNGSLKTNIALLLNAAIAKAEGRE